MAEINNSSFFDNSQEMILDHNLLASGSEIYIYFHMEVRDINSCKIYQTAYMYFFRQNRKGEGLFLTPPPTCRKSLTNFIT